MDATPLRQTVMPPYEIATLPGSNAAPLLPSSLTMRPQYGSSPYHEHLHSALSATRRAALKASSSDSAPMTRISTTLVAPSASPTIWRAKSMHASVTTARRASGSTAPATPLAKSSTVSFVDVQPSTDIRLKDSATPPARASWRSSGDAAASVVSTASMVATLGASIAAPLAMQPTKNPSPSTT